MKRLKMSFRFEKYWSWIAVLIVEVLLYKFIVKEGLIGVVRSGLPPKEAGLLAGIVLGDKSGFDREFYQQLKDVGLVHLVVASGTNVMLIFRGLIESAARYLGRKQVIILGLGMAWGYAGMVNWEIPIVRATIFISIYYWAQLLGRRFDLVRGLILTVLIMWLADNKMVTEVSFWMSFLAFLAIVTMPKLNIGSIGLNLMTTVWVSLWMTPILAMVFGKISLVSPLTNLLVIVVVEVVTIIGGAGMVIGLLAPTLGEMLLWLVYPMLKYFNLMVSFAGSWRWNSVEIHFNWWVLIGWYLIIGWWLMRRKDEPV
jgi:competence protein ComEC